MPKSTKDKKNKNMATMPVKKPNQRSVVDPVFRDLGNGSILVTHKEWIQSITSTTAAYQVAFSQPINPGLVRVFPWLNRIANNYEYYEFSKLDFVYTPNVSSDTNGAVAMSWDCDVLDTDPPDLAGLMAAHRAVKLPIYQELRMRVDPRDLHRPPQRFTRKGLHVVPDQKTFDIGKIVVATVGGPALVTGDLCVEYTVKFLVPQPRASLSEECGYFLAAGGAGAGVTPATPLGDVITKTGYLNVEQVNSSTFKFNDTVELAINILAQGTGLTAAAPTFVSNPLGAILTNVASSAVEGAANKVVHNILLKNTVPGAKLSMAMPGTTLSAVSYAMSLYPYTF